MAESDRRNPAPSTPTPIDGAKAPRIHFAKESTADGKLRLVERLREDVGITISREYVVSLLTDANQHNNLLVITTGRDDDTILIDQPKIGTLDISVNGKHYLISLALGQELAVRSGESDDTILATPRVTANMVVDSGHGNDLVITGRGNDFVDAGAQDDIVLMRDGKDYATGGDGNDFLDLGPGVDIGLGEDGNDILRGKQGDDLLYGGSGKNKLYGEGGKDVLFGSRKHDELHSNKADHIYDKDGIDPNLGASIKLEGTPAFLARVAADLDLLRSSPAGQQMLSEFDRVARTTGKTVTIKELTYEQNGYASGNSLGLGSAKPYLRNTPEGVIPGTGEDATIRFNPSFFNPGNVEGFLPFVILYHELSHAYNIVTGTLQPGIYVGSGIDATKVANRERQAVGLGNSGFDYDFDRDPNTPKTTVNPNALTENAIRKEAGLPARNSYELPPATPRAKPTAAGATAPLSPLEGLIERLAEAASANDPVAMQKAREALVASTYGKDFLEQGVVDFESQATEVAKKNSLAAEPPTQSQKTQQNLRPR